MKKFDLTLLPPAPDLSFEAPLWATGLRLVAGIDEAGRGALAGPVAAAALVLPPRADLCQTLSGVRDSKEMSPQDRQYWAEQLRNQALGYGVDFASNQEIDELGIVQATRLAMQRALSALPEPPEHLLIDFVVLPETHLPQTNLVKGDARSLSIAAASIMAKTTRDALMVRLDAQYPGYGFARHKGYGTADHRQALERLGPSPIHRLTFQFSAIDLNAT